MNKRTVAFSDESKAIDCLASLINKGYSFSEEEMYSAHKAFALIMYFSTKFSDQGIDSKLEIKVTEISRALSIHPKLFSREFNKISSLVFKNDDRRFELAESVKRRVRELDLK